MRAKDYTELGGKLRADGLTTGQIIARWTREHRLNPREAARLSHGMTQQQVAEHWNALEPDAQHLCTRKHISNWETSRQPGLDALNRLAQIYRCSAGDLLGGEDYSHLDGKPQHPGAAVLSVAVCIVVDEGQVLLVRSRGGGYQFPSGVVKPDQDAEDRAVEECVAETRVRCRPIRHLGGRVHPVSSAWCDYFLAEYLAGKAGNGQPDENSDVTWAPIERLDKFIPPDRVFGPAQDALEQHMAEEHTEPEPQVASAIVVSDRGVLLAARHDGKPPWTFPGGGIEAGETPADAAVREVKEETGVSVRVVRELGRRVHPKTGTAMAYVLCETTDSLEVHVGEPEDLSEVAWIDRAGLEERIPSKHMFAPVREHLETALPA